eukprot:Skav203713  [mRNA]  locus=scaffold259:549455:550169:- [translate_table: standard]
MSCRSMSQLLQAQGFGLGNFDPIMSLEVEKYMERQGHRKYEVRCLLRLPESATLTPVTDKKNLQGVGRGGRKDKGEEEGRTPGRGLQGGLQGRTPGEDSRELGEDSEFGGPAPGGCALRCAATDLELLEATLRAPREPL